MGSGTGGLSTPRLISLFLLSVAPATSLGCDGGRPAEPMQVSVVDSSGIRYVRLSSLTAHGLPEFETQRLWSTADLGGEEVELFRIADALFLPDSSLVIANGGTSQLLLVDGQGSRFSWIGGEGEGPGEFKGLRRLLPGPDGGFFAFDYRLSQFDRDGNFIQVRRLDSETPVVSMIPLAVLDDGRAVAVTGEQRIFQAEGERRDTVPLVTYASEAKARDTLGVWLGFERAFATVSAGSLLVPIGFARTVFSASNGRQIAIGSTDSLDVTVFADGLRPTLRFLSPCARRTATASQVSAWRKQMDERVPWNQETVEQAWQNAYARETVPDWEGLAIDEDGRVWIGEYLGPEAGKRRWLVFDATGDVSGFVSVPARPSPLYGGRTELLAVSHERLALLVLNRLDEPRVEVWTFSEGV